MFRKFIRSSIVALTCIVSLPSVSLAAEPTPIGQHGDWMAYALVEGGSKVCYMVSKPIDAKGNYTNRGEVFALITHRPAENTKDVFSYITGYTYKQGSDASVVIDGKNYILFTQDDTAWAPDAAADSALAKAIQAGSRMLVKGTSSRGTLTTDSYSLKGSGAAYKAISDACGIR